MNNQPVRQHWVPKVYLRAFCADPVDREQIYGVNLITGIEFFTSIERVAVKKHFYTLGLDTGDLSFEVEEVLSRLESDVRDVLADVRSRELLPSRSSARSILAAFIGTQLMRTRQGLQIVHGYRDEVRAGTGPVETRLPPHQATELLSLGNEGMREFFAKLVLKAGLSLGAHISKMQWNLIRAVDGYFITSENPVFTFHPIDSAWGVGSAGSITCFPLSPKLFLHLENEPTLPERPVHDLPAQGVRGLNGLTVLSAEQFLYSHVPFKHIQDLLVEREEGKRRAFGPRWQRGQGTNV